MKDAAAKTFILCVPVLVLGWLAVRDLAPGGEFAVEYTMGERSPYVNRLLPDERVATVDGIATIVDEPVYFSVKPPADDYKQVTVEMHFDPHDQPIVELGALTDIRAYAFDFRPMSNAILEDDTWFTPAPTTTGHAELETITTLFSKEKINATLGDFLAHPPERSEIATYRASFPTEYRISNYQPLGSTRNFSVSLRGSHEFLTYIKNETFTLNVLASDVNRTYGADDAYIRVWNEAGEVVLEEKAADDDNISEDQVPGDLDFLLRESDLPEGVYRVEMSGTSDIMWRQISTNQRYVTFKNKLYIGDDVGYRAEERATNFVTNSKRITFETFHSDSPQSITIDGETVAVPNAHEKIVHEIDTTGVVLGSTPKGDIKMVGEGKFALTADSFFDPDPVPLTPFTNLDEVAYVYATVAPVQEVDGWRAASATFELGTLDRENGDLKFAISTPGLPQLGSTVDVHKLTLTFKKDPMTLSEMLYEFVRRWGRALRDLI